MAKPGFGYTEPDCCGNCEFINLEGSRICQNEKQMKLPGNELKGGGYFPTNFLFVNTYGKCKLHKRIKD